MPNNSTNKPEDNAVALGMVSEVVNEWIKGYLGNDLVMTLGFSQDVKSEITQRLVDKCLKDIEEFAKRDPASGGSVYLIRHAYSGYAATVGYRLSHEIHRISGTIRQAHLTDILKVLARKISEDVKGKYRVEIHPGADIGPGIILDHARGVVIGETAIVGARCCILQGVVLGAAEVNQNSSVNQRRHPKIGDDVTICGNAMVFGNIEIGNNVTIGPHVFLREDVPDGMKVTLQTIVQYRRLSEIHAGTVRTAIPPRIFGVVPHQDEYEKLLIYGLNLEQTQTVCLVDSGGVLRGMQIKCEVKVLNSMCLEIKLNNKPDQMLAKLDGLWLEICFRDGISPILIRYHEGLKYFLEQYSKGRN